MSAKVLVVDDNPLNVKMLADILAFNGYQVVKASGGQEALAQVAGGKARPRAARRDDARPRRLRGVHGDSRQPGDGDAAGGDGHRARSEGRTRQGTGRGRRRLPVQAGQPARTAGPGAVAAADQGLSRPGAGAGARAAGVEPHAGAPCRGRRAASRETEPHEAVPLAAGRRTGSRCRRVAQEPPRRNHRGVPGHPGLHGFHRDSRSRRSAAGAARVPRARWASSSWPTRARWPASRATAS